MIDTSMLMPGVIILDIPDEESWDEVMDALQRAGSTQEPAKFGRTNCIRLFEGSTEGFRSGLRWRRGDVQTYRTSEYEKYIKYQYDEIVVENDDVASLFDELFE